MHSLDGGAVGSSMCSAIRFCIQLNSIPVKDSSKRLNPEFLKSWRPGTSGQLA